MSAKNKNKRYVPVVDSCWGWMVVVGSFFIHVFADGIVYSFGVLLEVIMKEFGATNAKASIIISLLTGLTLGFGPVASAITNKFGCRFTTILGSIIASIGCAASYYATSVEYLMLSVGCVMGMGFGLMYCPAIVIVTMYFEKKRAMATGIAVCGAGVGTVLFAPISETLIESFSWRTVFIYYTVVVALCSLCGLTFRPLPFVEVEEELEECLRNDEKKIYEHGNFEEKGNEIGKETEEKVLLKGIRPSNSHTSVNEKIENAHDPSEFVSKRRRTVSESSGYMDVKDVFFTGSVNAIPDYNLKHDLYRSITSLHKSKEDNMKGLEILEEKEEDEEEQERNKASELWRTLVKMTDLSLLLDPVFLLYAVSNLLTSIAFNSPLVFLPSHASNLGCTGKQAARVVSAFGLMNTTGRILIGVVSDRQLPTKFGKDTARNRLWIYNLSLTFCGILTTFVFLCSGFYSLAVYSGLFGLTLSSYVCLTSVLLVDLLGIERLTNAFGLVLLFQGVGTVIGPPISGRLADLTNSYNLSFVFCGISLMISGLMLFFIPWIQKRTQSKSSSSNVP